MIDFYQGIETKTNQPLAYLQELSQVLNPQKSANDNYQAIERLSEELGSREAFNRLRPDDKKLAQALIEAKRSFLDEASKAAYDKKLQQLRPVPEASQPDVQVSSTTFQEEAAVPKLESADPKPSSKLTDKQRPWLTLLLAFVSFWLAVLIFIYLQWDLMILLILLGIVLILFLLLDD